VWWGDDRFVPRDHPLSNALPLDEVLLRAAAFAGTAGDGEASIDVEVGNQPGALIPASNIHAMPMTAAIAMGEGPAWVASAYDEELRATKLPEAGGIPVFDVVLSGIGAAHASGRPTVIVTGDLGLLHDIGGLAALRDVRGPVRIVVVNNDGGGIFHFLPQEEAMVPEEFEGLLGTPRSVDVAKAADMFGIEHRNIDDLEHLDDAKPAPAPAPGPDPPVAWA